MDETKITTISNFSVGAGGPIPYFRQRTCNRTIACLLSKSKLDQLANKIFSKQFMTM